MDDFQQDLYNRIINSEKPIPPSLSRRYPCLQKPIVFFRRGVRRVYNMFTLGQRLRVQPFFAQVAARHSSLLLRKLGESDMYLQHNKVRNLSVAIGRLNGLVIPCGKTFSLWREIGLPTVRQGYLPGMLLSQGQVSEGVGGGLCQLSNFLTWIFLHTGAQLVERHHHSVDAFPDSGRTLPFGSGATILYNYRDLKIKNITSQPLQIKLWLTATHLKGQILTPGLESKKFRVVEKNHCFLQKNNHFFRFNEIFQETYERGQKIKTEKIFTNFAPVTYALNAETIKQLGYRFIDFDTLSLP